ncbi:MAG TPA: 2-phospho-L-lactate guanylyltransferase [Chloroflexota bacterium]
MGATGGAQPQAGPGVMRALLPVRELNTVKRRLSSVLTDKERQRLVLAMLGDVIRAGHGAGFVLDVLSADPDVLAFAAGLGANPLREHVRQKSLNAALEWALSTRYIDESLVMVLLPDVPLVTSDELTTLVAAALVHSGPCVMAVPDRAADGTNALICQPPWAIPMRFGPHSLRGHSKLARARGIHWDVCSLPGLAMDIDVEADLSEFLARPSETDTYRLLTELGIPARFSQRAIRK